jgi:hypothetical protein
VHVSLNPQSRTRLYICQKSASNYGIAYDKTFIVMVTLAARQINNVDDEFGTVRTCSEM